MIESPLEIKKFRGLVAMSKKRHFISDEVQILCVFFDDVSDVLAINLNKE